MSDDQAMEALRPWIVLAAIVGSTAVASGRAQTVPAPLRPMVTDRPGNTDSPQTVPAGMVQLEIDFATLARDTRGSQRATSLSIAATNLKYGLTDALDLQLIATPYRRDEVEDRGTGAEASTEGWSNTTLRLKWNLWGNDAGPTAAALIPFVVLPTGDPDLETEELQGGLALPFALDLGQGLGFGAWTAAAALRDPDDRDHEFVWRSTVKLSSALGERWQVWGELFAQVPSASDAFATADLGLVFQPRPDLAFDATVFVGLNEAAPDLALALGLSWRF
jgi:hypothetical protein